MRRKNHLKGLGAVLAILVAFSTVSAWAYSVVEVTSSGFSPASITIPVGGTVYFVVADDNGPYCIQSTIGAWTPWYLWEYEDYFGLQFNQKGDYYYRDTFTWNSGVIHVGTSPPNVPPTVIITSPADGAVLTEPGVCTFAAEVTDPDNGVWEVDFYVGADLVDTLYSGPYSTQVTNLAAGNYTLKVVAYDMALAATTKSVNVTVQPWTPPNFKVEPPTIVGGQLLVNASGMTVGKQAVLQASTSLGPSANWIPLQTNVLTSSPVSFSRPVLPGTQFFRVLQLP